MPLYQLCKKHGVEAVAEKLKARGKVKSADDVRRALVEGRSKYDQIYYAKHCLKIRTKEGKLVPLVANNGQKKLQDAIDKARAEGKPVRIKMPKARQFGGSTWTQGLYYGDVNYNDHIQLLTVCHDLDSARNMRSMFERYKDNNWLHQPQIKKISEKWWRIPSKDIDYIIDTAEELDTGRSFTIHRLHASEVAFYRNPEILMTGLLQAVPDQPNTAVVLESTANGMGGWWYDFIMNDNDYTLVFVGWWEIEEYTRPFLNDSEKIELKNNLDAYEKGLIDTFGLTLEQMNWRRYTIDNKLNGDEEKFRQEYPATVEESFITSGRPYFPMTVIKRELVKAKKAQPKIGYLEWSKYNEEVTFSEDKNGWWKIFEEPDIKYENLYVGGADPAEGKSSTDTNKDPDYSVYTIRNRKTKAVSARFRARVDTDVFEDEIYKGVIYYKTCVDAIERNNTAGGAIIKGLKQKDKINLFKKELQGKTEEGETIEYGWQTNRETREILLSDLRRSMKDGSWIDSDNDFWSEASVFVIDKSGKATAMQGRHDDVIFSSGLALQAESQAVEFAPIVVAQEREKLPYDVDTDDWGTPELHETVETEF